MWDKFSHVFFCKIWHNTQDPYYAHKMGATWIKALLKISFEDSKGEMGPSKLSTLLATTEPVKNVPINEEI